MDKHKFRQLQNELRKILRSEISAMEHKLRFGHVDDDDERASLAYQIAVHRAQLSPAL